jgi:predicted nucleic acid-binding protein
MIADTTFLIHFHQEGRTGRGGPARMFFADHRREVIRTSVISLAEIAPCFRRSLDAWQYFDGWKVYSLHSGIAQAAADVDRELLRSGQRLGENDNWIAGFCRYYREALISLDEAFDRVPGLRRVVY